MRVQPFMVWVLFRLVLSRSLRLGVFGLLGAG